MAHRSESVNQNQIAVIDNIRAINQTNDVISPKAPRVMVFSTQKK